MNHKMNESRKVHRTEYVKKKGSGYQNRYVGGNRNNFS